MSGVLTSIVCLQDFGQNEIFPLGKGQFMAGERDYSGRSSDSKLEEGANSTCKTKGVNIEQRPQ